MTSKRKVLAIASGGGHWIQLLRVRPAWDGCDVTYATTDRGHAAWLRRDAAIRHQNAPEFIVLAEANRWQKAKLLLLILQVAFILIKLRPDFIITTGASQGYFALRIGKLLGARTAWIDSIANSEEMSLSGLLARPYADIWLTQWEHVSNADIGLEFKGAVL
jgi:UDP-N-acetylglucosamine:LPS N-acetylglucosamine transferase